MPLERELIGIVACGGQSRRMGTDKSMIRYHRLPQRYHVYELLKEVCSRVYISCNESQVKAMEPGYLYIQDDDEFQGAGPLTAVLTACKHFTGADLLITGCDYPYLDSAEMKEFTSSLKNKSRPAAFFDLENDLYIPVLGFYPAGSEVDLIKWKDDRNYSLRQFLKEKHACKYVPGDSKSIISVDDADSALKVNLLKTSDP